MYRSSVLLVPRRHPRYARDVCRFIESSNVTAVQSTTSLIFAVGLASKTGHMTQRGSVWSNSPEPTGTCPVGPLPPASQWFGEVRCVRTTLNSLEPALSARFPLHHSGSGRFGMVEPPQTQSNLPCRPASPFITCLRRFGVVEPPRTQSNLPCRPASPFITVLREGSVCSNRSELTRTCPVGPLPTASQWFGKVRYCRTAPNSVEPPRTQSNLPCRPASPLHHSGLRRFGVFEPLQTHSNLPCRPASPCISGLGRFGVVEPPRTQSNQTCRPAYPFITVVRGGSVWSNRPELTRTCPIGLLPPFITVVRGGSVWSNRFELTRTCPVGLLSPSSQ